MTGGPCSEGNWSTQKSLGLNQDCDHATPSLRSTLPSILPSNKLLRASSKPTPCYAKVTVQMMAPRPGFEPGLEDSKSSVLPLDDLGMNLDSRIYSALRREFGVAEGRDFS